MIKDIVRTPEEGKIYNAKVVKIIDYLKNDLLNIIEISNNKVDIFVNNIGKSVEDLPIF